MADSRIKNLTNETALAATDTFAIDREAYTNAKNVTAQQVKTFVWKVITDAGIIATITDFSNWNDDSVYIGSTVGLVAGDQYVDISLGIKYEYNGVYLIRYHINNVI